MGIDHVINCTALFNVRMLELYVGGRRQAKVWDYQFVTTSLSVVDSGLNETDIMCKAQTFHGNTYQKTETLYIKGIP